MPSDKPIKKKIDLSGITYDAETGGMYRTRKKGGAGVIGFVTTKHPDGYLSIVVCGTRYLQHRLAFQFMGLEIPAQVDHINGVRDDNRWGNLRAATHTQNAQNTKPRGGLKYKGVQRSGNKWAARIQYEGVRHCLGSFTHIEDAALAYNCAASTFYGEFARLNIVGVI